MRRRLTLIAAASAVAIAGGGAYLVDIDEEARVLAFASVIVLGIPAAVLGAAIIQMWRDRRYTQPEPGPVRTIVMIGDEQVIGDASLYERKLP